MRRVRIAAVVALTLLGCDQTQPLFGPRVVDVVTAERATVPELIDFEAVLEPPARVEVTARTEGYLLERNFEDGTEIEQDRVLFILQADAYEAAAREARAALEQRQATLEQTASKDAPSSTAAERAALEESRARADQAEIALSYTTLRAPIDGRIDSHLVDVGNLVRVGDPLATIVQLDPIHASFSVPAEDLARLRKAHREEPLLLQLQTSDDGMHDRTGRIDVIGGEIDEETGRVAMRGVVPNPRVDLLGGQRATARLLLRWHVDAVVVPERAVERDAGGPFVWIVGDDDRVERRGIDLGPTHAQNRVVLSGLDGGERIVAGRSRAAVAGRRVRAEPTTIAARATPGLAPRVQPPTPTPSPKPSPSATPDASPPPVPTEAAAAADGSPETATPPAGIPDTPRADVPDSSAAGVPDSPPAGESAK